MLRTKAPGKVCSPCSHLLDVHQLHSIYFSCCACPPEIKDYSGEQSGPEPVDPAGGVPQETR